MDPARIVEQVMILPFLIMGLSHIFRPSMWRIFFTRLHEMGEVGVIYRSFMLEIPFALLLVVFHQVWHGLGLILTLYGIALMGKITVGMLFPQLGLRSLAMADRHGDIGFRLGGVVLTALGLVCVWLVFG